MKLSQVLPRSKSVDEIRRSQLMKYERKVGSTLRGIVTQQLSVALQLSCTNVATHYWFLYVTIFTSCYNIYLPLFSFDGWYFSDQDKIEFQLFEIFYKY